MIAQPLCPRADPADFNFEPEPESDCAESESPAGGVTGRHVASCLRLRLTPDSDIEHPLPLPVAPTVPLAVGVTVAATVVPTRGATNPNLLQLPHNPVRAGAVPVPVEGPLGSLCFPLASGSHCLRPWQLDSDAASLPVSLSRPDSEYPLADSHWQALTLQASKSPSQPEPEGPSPSQLHWQVTVQVVSATQASSHGDRGLESESDSESDSDLDLDSDPRPPACAELERQVQVQVKVQVQVEREVDSEARVGAQLAALATRRSLLQEELQVISALHARMQRVVASRKRRLRRARRAATLATSSSCPRS
jgi:hypothetical protein